MADTLFKILFAITWQSAVLAATIGAVVWIFGERLQPRFRYLLWCVVLLRLALPILPSMPWGVWSDRQQPSDVFSVAEKEWLPSTPIFFESQSIDVAPMIEPQPLPPPGTASSRARLGPDWLRHVLEENWKAIILAVWLAGVAVLAIRYVYDEIRLFRRSRYWKPVDDPNVLAIVERCRKEIGVRRQVKLLSVSHGIGAAATGLFAPKILISEQAMSNSPDQLRMVFLHEMVHIKRVDPFLLRLATILSLIHWPNPAVWFAVSRLQRERELACDAAVLDKLGSIHRKEYGQAVLAFAELFSARERLPGLVGVFQKNNIIRRIDMILKHRKYKISHAILGVLLVLAVAGFGLTKAQTQNPSVQSPQRQQGTDVPISELETELFKNTQAAYQKTYDALNGDITIGTAEQKGALIYRTADLANLYRQQGRMDEAIRLISDCKRYVSLLEKEAERSENKEEKEGLLTTVAQTHSTFAQFGMIDEAVAVAKMSPETRQYNASEYLAKTARIIASREGLDKAVPILDEAIAVAKKLPEPFWRERGIVEVAELYEEAGLSQQARALIDTLSPDGKVRGLLALFNVLRKKKKDETALLPLLRESEHFAEQSDKAKEQSPRLFDIADAYIQLDRFDEAKKLFEKSGLADNPAMRNEFQSSLAYHLIEQGKYAEAEAAVEKMKSPESKARVLMRILQQAAVKSDIPTMKRLIPIAEPYLVHLEPFAHRLHHQLYLAAYKMQVGDVTEGRKMMDDLIAGPPIEGLDRNESISRAIGGLCYAGLYDEARKKAETMTSPAAKASAYELIEAIYLQNVKPEEYKKRFRHEIREETTNEQSPFPQSPPRRQGTDGKPLADASGSVRSVSVRSGSVVADSEKPLTIRGTVIDETKKPVAGVGVYSYDTGNKLAETDRNGEFAIVLLEGKFPHYGSLAAIDGERKQIGHGEFVTNPNSKTVRAKPITLYPARTITGTVVDPEGRPASNVMVAGCNQITTSEIVKTNEKGEFSFLYPTNQPLQEVYALQKGKAFDFVSTEEYPSYYGETPKSLISNGPFALKLRPIEPFRVRVVNQSGKPIAGATVEPWLIKNPVKPKNLRSLNDQRDFVNTSGMDVFHVKTDVEGFATIDSVPADFLKDSTFNAVRYDSTAENGESEKSYGAVSKSWKELVQDEKSSVPTFELPQHAEVQGTVKLEDGTPVPKAQLVFRYHDGSCGSGMTDENGEFSFSENANTLFNISVDSDKGAAPAIFNYDIGDGETKKRLDIVLKKGIRLYGKVSTADGKPVKEFYFTVSEIDPNPPASFQGIPSGKRSRFVYGTNRSDRWLGPRNVNTDGDYECFLSTEPREYTLNVNGEPQSAGVGDHKKLKINGDEKEIRLDFQFKSDLSGVLNRVSQGIQNVLIPKKQSHEQSPPRQQGTDVKPR